MLKWLFAERIATTVEICTETGELLTYKRRPWSKWLHDEFVEVDAASCLVTTENDLGTAIAMARDAIHRFKVLQPPALAAQES